MPGGRRKIHLTKRPVGKKKSHTPTDATSLISRKQHLARRLAYLRNLRSKQVVRNPQVAIPHSQQIINQSKLHSKISAQPSAQPPKSYVVPKHPIILPNIHNYIVDSPYSQHHSPTNPHLSSHLSPPPVLLSTHKSHAQKSNTNEPHTYTSRPYHSHTLKSTSSQESESSLISPPILHQTTPLFANSLNHSLLQSSPYPLPPKKESKVSSVVPLTQNVRNVTRSSTIWNGLNIHSYTPQVNEISHQYMPNLVATYGERLSTEEFSSILEEMNRIYGNKVTYSNLRNVFRDGCIRDPEVPGMNFALVLKATWEKVKTDPSLTRHFGETLDDIGSLCIQGVTHRLFIDYVALVEDEKFI